MKKYFALLGYELKNLTKDKMNLFMIFYPFLMIFITAFVIPKITEQSDDPVASMYILLVMFLISIVLGCFVGGVMLGFSLLDNKDERTINTIAVTPASIKGYILFKSVYCCIFSFISNLLIIYGIMLFAKESYTLPSTGNIFDNIANWQIFVYSFVNSLITPAIALIIATVAKNKVEGFVIVKAGGMVLMLPVLMLLNAFNGFAQYALGILPNFWSTKALYNEAVASTAAENLPFALYMIIGAAFSIALSVLFYKLFSKKLQIIT